MNGQLHSVAALSNYFFFMRIDINDYRRKVDILVDEYHQIRDEEKHIMRMHEINESIQEMCINLSFLYYEAVSEYSDYRAIHDVSIETKIAELMEEKEINGKKPTAAYCTSLAKASYGNDKVKYMKADADEKGIRQIMNHFSNYCSMITQRIASLKKGI